MDLFHENIQRMFRAVIERLYYSETVKIGNSRMPGDKIRSYLELLEADDLNCRTRQDEAKTRPKNHQSYRLYDVYDL